MTLVALLPAVRPLPVLLAASVLAAVALVVWIASVVRRAREAAEFEGAAAGVPPDGGARAPDVDLDDLHRKLARSFRDGIARLREIRGRDARYEVPWVLVAGESRAGKTAALAGCGLQRPFDASAPGNAPASERDPLRWELFDRGVALDLKGDLFLRPDGSTYEEGWGHFLRLLARHRPRRPLDGIVLAVPASLLRGPDARDQAAARGEAVSRRLREMQRALGVRLPVYLLVTRCDALPGFASLAAQLPEGARDEAFGWASPHHVDAAFRPEWVDAAFEEIHGDLLGTQAEMLAEAADPDGVFQLPREVEGLAPAARAFLEETFRESVYHESFFFRGLYLTGSADPAAALTAAAADVPPTALPDPPADVVGAAGALAGGGGEDGEDPAPAARPVFLRDLLGEKVFAERNLARRASGGRFGRDRAVLAAQGVMAAAVLVGGLGLLVEGPRLERRDGELSGRLRQVAAAMRPLERRDGETAILPLLDEIARVDPGPLYSAFAPTSWVDPVRRRVTRVAAGALSDAILPAVRDSLERRVERLAPAGRMDLAAGLSGAGPRERPTGDSVQRYLEALGELSTSVRRFNTLARHDSGSVNQLDSLVAYVFNERPRHEGRARTGVLARALRQSRTRRITGPPRTGAALARADGLVGAAYDHLLAQVRGLQEDVDAAAGAGPAQLPLEHYRRMAGRVDSVRGAVDGDWLNAAGGLPPDLDKALRAIPNSDVIRGDELRAAFPARFAAARDERLRSAEEALARVYGGGGVPFGAAGTEDSGGGGEAGGGALALRTVLDALEGRPFMGRGAPVSLLAPAPEGTWPVWNLRGLDEALALHADYQAYTRDRLEGVDPGARALVRGLATVALEAAMTQAVAGARGWVPAARPFGLPARERDLRTRAAALRPAADRILRLVAAFDSLGLAGPRDELASLLVHQNASLLSDAAQLLADSGPYAPLDPDFQWWSGETPLAPRAFGAADGEELEVYLARQRAAVSGVAHGIAAPLLADFESPALDAYDRGTGIRGERGPAVAVRWRALVRALDGYEARAPGNSLVALEQFIRTGMDAADLGACDASLGRRGAVLDLFGQLRERLRDPLAARCRAVAVDRVAAAYGRLRAQFQEELAGRFPFVPPGADDDGEADVDAVRRFYRALDGAAWADSLVRGGGAGVGGPGSEAAAFLEAVAATRPFLAALLGADTSGGPAFHVTAEFRAARARERGGEQVAEWWLEVGADRLSPRDPDGTAAPWRAGDAVRLGVRWAADGPRRPVPSGLAAPGRVQDRAVSWSFGGDWALLQMLSVLGATGADLGASPARQRHTLTLSVPTVAAADADPAAVPERARVFVRVRLRDPATGAERALPAFPDHAPALTRGRGGSGRVPPPGGPARGGTGTGGADEGMPGASGPGHGRPGAQASRDAAPAGTVPPAWTTARAREGGR